MRLNLAIILLGAVCLIASTGNAADDRPRIKIDQEPNKFVIRALAPGTTNWTDLATYVAEPGQRPYLHPVYDASGRQVLTQNKPEDHPWQHGIFTGFHRVNGFNYWKEDEGQQRLARVSDVKQEREKVGWRSLIELVAPGGEVVLEEENIIAIHAPESTNLYVIDFTLMLRAKNNEVQIGKFFVGGLSIRMPWEKENPQQTHLNSEGLLGRAGEQKRASWCTVEQPFGGQIFGFAIFDHPRNTNHPPSWRVDEQGLINPNVSGLSDWRLAPGQERRFQYRILVYRGAANAEKLSARFEKFSGGR